MSELNPEESFTFVDKRKINSAESHVVDAEESSLPPESVEDESYDPHGTYGLAAYVTGLIASDAWQKMGLIADQATGKVKIDLSQARFGIDCVAALVGVLDTHQDSLTPELLRDLKRVLSDLRLNFVEQSRRAEAKV